MEEKNEINGIKEDLILNSKKENYLLIFSDVEKQFNLLKSYVEIIKENQKNYANILIPIDKMNQKSLNFLKEKDYKDYATIENSPIFHLADILNEINLTELRELSNAFTSYFKRQEMIVSRLKQFLEHYEVLKEPDSNRKKIITKLNKACRKIEMKIIDDYLFISHRKFNKFFEKLKNIIKIKEKLK